MNCAKKLTHPFFILTFYGFALAFVKFNNVYEFSTRPESFIIPAYHLFRIVVLLGILVSFVVTGYLFIERIVKINTGRWMNLEKLAAYFFTGASILQIVIFICGFIIPYSELFFISITMPQIVYFLLSSTNFHYHLKHTWTSVAPSVGMKNTYVSFFVIFAVSFVFIYVKHCLYTGDGDYLTHYLPYHMFVLENGNLFPNEIWYHFFYSKGAGLVLLLMQLTDVHAVTLVSFSFAIFSILLCSCLLYRGIKNSVVCLIFSATLLLCLFKTDDGFFVKHHAEIGGHIVFITFLLILYNRHGSFDWKKYLSLCILACVSLVVLSPPMSFFPFMFAATYFLYFLIVRNFAKAKFYFVLLFVFLLSIFIVFGINYSLTGLFEITPFRVFLSHWNENIFGKFFSPYLMIYLAQGSGPDMGTVSLEIKNDFLILYPMVLRLNELPTSLVPYGISLIIVLFVLICCLLARLNILSSKARSQTGRILSTLTIPSLLMLLFVFVTVFAVNQRTSLYRSTEYIVYYSALVLFSIVFLFFLFLQVGIEMSVFALSKMQLKKKYSLCMTTNTVLSVLAIMLIFLFITSGLPKLRELDATKQLSFILGRTNLADSLAVDLNAPRGLAKFREQKLASGSIVSFVIGTRFGDLFYHYPGVATEMSYAFGKDWHILAFESPDKVKEYYQKLGINYFMIDTEGSVFGCLPFSPLFQWQTLDKYFDVCFGENGIYILTWKNGEKSNITKEIKEKWKQTLAKKNFSRPLYERVKLIYEYNNGLLHDIKIPPNLPSVEGWQ